MIKVSRYSLFVLAILLLNLETLNAATILGKVAVYMSSSDTDTGIQTHPLVSGNKMGFDHKALIKIVGGTLIADEGTILQAFDKEEQIGFQIDKGAVYFRILPSKVSVSFKTPQGEVSSPRVAPASVSTLTGRIIVGDKETTVDVTEGSLEALTPKGLTKVSGGQELILAQAEVESKTESKETALVGGRLPERLLMLLGLIGEPGTAATTLNPEGKVDLAKVRTWHGKGEVVNYDLKTVQNANLPKGTPVKVVCIRVNNGKNESDLLIRPIDKLYPEKEGEINLVGRSVTAQSRLNPEGMAQIEKKAGEFEQRSWDNWNSVYVDNNLQPVKNAAISEGTKLRITCIRSTLLLQPVDKANREHIGLLGKDAVADTRLNPGGKVLIEGKSWDGVVVDYNLQPIGDADFPKGTGLRVVGAKGTGTTLLVEPLDKTQEETEFLGKTVVSETQIDPYGNVLVDGKSWWGVIVDENLQPIEGASLPAGTEFKVVSVTSTLLVQPDSVLIAALPLPGSVTPLSSFALVAIATGGLVGGGVVAAIQGGHGASAGQ